MKIPFFKMHGAGNDFIVVDDRTGGFPLADAAFVRQITDRRAGVGSDGVLLMQDSGLADVRMRVLNPDGGEAAMCGNGARCLARLAYALNAAGAEMTLETGAGVVPAAVLDDAVVVLLGAARDMRLAVDPGLPWLMDTADTGVPHAVAWVDDVAAINLQQVGGAIRHHPLFAPSGTNADVAQVLDDGSVAIRTYERGVEAETSACGTGAAAVAALAVERGFAGFPIVIHCAGGHELVIDDMNGALSLRGGAVMLFEGELAYGDRV